MAENTFNLAKARTTTEVNEALTNSSKNKFVFQQKSLCFAEKSRAELYDAQDDTTNQKTSWDEYFLTMLELLLF